MTETPSGDAQFDALLRCMARAHRSSGILASTFIHFPRITSIEPSELFQSYHFFVLGTAGSSSRSIAWRTCSKLAFCDPGFAHVGLTFVSVGVMSTDVSFPRRGGTHGDVIPSASPAVELDRGCLSLYCRMLCCHGTSNSPQVLASVSSSFSKAASPRAGPSSPGLSSYSCASSSRSSLCRGAWDSSSPRYS